MKPGTIWPFIIAGALGLHVIASLVMVCFATSNPSYAVEPDYYRKALAWDEKRAQDARNTEIGWRLEFTVKPGVVGQDPLLHVEITTIDGEPVTDATVQVEAFANARRDDILTARLSPSDSGYETTMPMRRDGRWEFRFTVTRGAELFTYAEMRHVWTHVEEGR